MSNALSPPSGLLETPSSLIHQSDTDDPRRKASTLTWLPPFGPLTTTLNNFDSERKLAVPFDTSSERVSGLRNVHGRNVNKANELYLMPADEDEYSRLDIQHEMLKVDINGLYWPSDHVRRILVPRPDGVESPSVLDIGTGSGSWAIEMAKEFPHVQVVGLDLALPGFAETPPPNCRFERGDINKDLKRYKEQFEVIHVRCVDSGIEDGLGFYHQVFDLLRPGGILLVGMGNFMHGEDRMITTEEDQTAVGFSWVAMMMRTYFNSAVAEQCGALSVTRYQDWMRNMSAWETQGHKQYLIPMGPWKPDMTERERRASELARKNWLKLSTAWRPGLLAHGYDEETVNRWVVKAQEEIVSMIPHAYVAYQASWALKPGRPSVASL